MPFKWDSQYLQEWLDFHLTTGIQHFYLYDNNYLSPEEHEKSKYILEPYIKSGQVTYHDVTRRKNLNFYSFDHCLEQYKHESKWIAFIDSDEFLFYCDPHSSWAELLSPYSQFAGVAVNCLLYGGNYQKFNSKDPVLKRFTRRSNRRSLEYKIIGQPEFIRAFAGNPHHPNKINRGFHIVNEKFEKLKQVPSNRFLASYSKFRINHYFTKSEEEYVNIKIGRTLNISRGGSRKKRYKRDLKKLIYEDFGNVVEDDSALYFLNSKKNLKNKIEKLRTISPKVMKNLRALALMKFFKRST